MTAADRLTAELRAEVTVLEGDLRRRLDADEAKKDQWQALHREAVRRERTAATWQAWADDRITQAAAAWTLFTVFVRFGEDNALVRPVWISGPQNRRQEAIDGQAQFIREQARINPDVTDREWLLQAAEYLSSLPATRALVDEHSAMRLIEPSGDAAARLLTFWRERGEDGVQLRDLTDQSLDTRFLGDLYQDLSESAREKYALLQTPEFVEEFILDRTLEPALAERPLDGFRMIDPTCGSGHFLLGAFRRLLDRWHVEAPGMDERERVQRALNSVHGVDINPYAVAITRFRLTVAALRASGEHRLEDAPAFAYHVAVGDSLLHGAGQRTLASDADLHDFVYGTEDVGMLEEILAGGRYDAVVGNPPYITVKDKALNAEYRRRCNYCKGTYAMTVPFMERFFTLAKTGERSGWVGQITSNSFMKRRFGAPLIERFLPSQDLVLVIDTSGAYIPGHGTPTVIIVGRHQRPTTGTVRTVLGIRGEPGRPEVAAKGKVWTSIVEHVDEPGWTDDWISSTDLERMLLDTHPWSLSGGGALRLRAALDSSSETLGGRVERMGMFGDSHAEDVLAAPTGTFARLGCASSDIATANAGDNVRDWLMSRSGELVLPPGPVDHPHPKTQSLRALWPWRASLWARMTFSSDTYRTAGKAWLSWHQISVREPKRLHIAFVKIATHNHFVIARAGLVEKPSTLRVELPEGASKDDHLALLGVLNSSTACFWLKQNSHNKGRPGAEQAGADELWEQRYEFTGTTLQDFPLPASLPLDRARVLDTLAQRLADQMPVAVCARNTPALATLAAAHAEYDQIRADMVAVQEEWDWEVYQLYGLIGEQLTYSGDDLPAIMAGERAFAIALARRMASGAERTTWFIHHNHKYAPTVELPTHWPAKYRDLVYRRIELAESHPYIRLLEKPEHKRRWAAEPWEKMEERALREWLLDRLEDRAYWFDRQGRPNPRSVAQLADEVSRDPELTGVLALWEGRPDIPVAKSLEKLVAEEAVPYLAAYRYKESGLRKRKEWERTWELQRREDAGETIDIVVPPKYVSADFTRKEYWANRGKLDVPKERFVLYPDAGRDTDPTPVLGWAGWDHAQQSLALAQLVQQRQSDGWTDDRLIPLVAGLAELQPWVDQWHAEPDPFYGGASPAEFFREQLAAYAAQLGKTTDQLRNWQPDRTIKRRPRKAKPA